MAKKRLYTTDEAAELLGVSSQKLRLARSKARRKFKGPAYVKDGDRVFYTDADLDAWIAAHRVELEPRGDRRRSAN